MTLIPYQGVMTIKCTRALCTPKFLRAQCLQRPRQRLPVGSDAQAASKMQRPWYGIRVSAWIAWNKKEALCISAEGLKIWTRLDLNQRPNDSGLCCLRNSPDYITARIAGRGRLVGVIKRPVPLP